MSNNEIKENKTQNNISEETNVENAPLTEQQVYDVLKFAQETYKYAYNNYPLKFDRFDGTYSPYLTNERLSEIGLSPKNLQQKDLKKILESPIGNQENLIGYSEFLKFNDMIAKRTLGYLGNLPAFDYTFTCTNIDSPEEYQSEEYKNDLRIVKDFLSKFDVQGQFSYINRRTFEIDAFYSIFRMDGDRYEFQELPYQYCKITGKNLSWGFQFDFDMSWFDKMGLSIEQYPPIFQKMKRRVEKGKNAKDYNPSNKLNKRKGTYVLWSQTSSLPDKGNFACFKMNSDIYAITPYLTPMFHDSINKPIIRELQNNQYIIASQKIMIGLIPLLKEQKSGQIKDALAVSPETMGQFLGLLKRGLSEAIKITGAPFSDVKQVEFDQPQTSIYDQFSKNQASNSGATSRIIYSSDKMSSSEIELSTELDRIISESVYPQYERWLSSMINYFTKKYKFNFKFKGSKFKSNREKRLDAALKLADKGLVDFQEIASACGENIFTFEEKIMASSYSPIWGKLKLLPNSNTKDYGSTDVGRPKTETPSDSLERSDDYIKE